MKTVIYHSAGGVVIDGGRILVLDRPARGEVRLPKGHIDPGESPEEAALRETTEESGYADLEIVDDLGQRTVEFDHDGKHVVRQERYFLMRLRSDYMVPRDVKDTTQFTALWVEPEEAFDLLTYAAEQQVARAAIASYEILQGREGT
jgi:ADP-ribose pyrophosphatase YjhB (NUDIX family)